LKQILHNKKDYPKFNYEDAIQASEFANLVYFTRNEVKTYLKENDHLKNFELLLFLDDCRQRSPFYNKRENNFFEVANYHMNNANSLNDFRTDRCLDNVSEPVNSEKDEDSFINGALFYNKLTKTIFVTFRGTADLKDAIADAYISLRPFVFKEYNNDHKYKDICIHTGFFESVAEKMDYLY